MLYLCFSFNIEFLKYYLTIITVFSFLLSSYSQLYVKDKSILTVNSKLYSKQTQNNFESEISGEGIIIFASEKEQTVTSNKKITVKNIEFRGTSPTKNMVEINNSIKITGDVTLTNVTLKLNEELYLSGELINNNSIIINEHLINGNDPTSFDTEGVLAYTNQLKLSNQNISLINIKTIIKKYIFKNKSKTEIVNHYFFLHDFKSLKPPQNFV